MKLLVGYASAHGSTAEVARFMGDVFKERAFDVTVASVDTVTSVDEYDACVIGSAIHGGMWLTPMSQFVERFETALAARPVYYWMTCIRVLEAEGMDHILKYYIHRPTLDKIGVRDIGVFAGKLSMEAINWDDRWTLSVRYDGADRPADYNNDYRDWRVIRAWALKVAEALNPG